MNKLMHRNLDRRVEALVRITDPEMIERLTWLVTHAASDAVTSWWLEPDGSWVRHVTGPDGESSSLHCYPNSPHQE